MNNFRTKGMAHALREDLAKLPEGKRFYGGQYSALCKAHGTNVNSLYKLLRRMARTGELNLHDPTPNPKGGIDLTWYSVRDLKLSQPPEPEVQAPPPASVQPAQPLASGLWGVILGHHAHADASRG